MATLKRKTNNGYEPLPAMVVRKTNAENGNGIGTCSTSSGTALTVSLTGYELVQNGFIAVTFEYDVPAGATLNINNKGAKAIYNEGSAIEANVIKAGKTVMFAYDGTNYVVTSLGGGGGVEPEPLYDYIILDQTSSDPTTKVLDMEGNGYTNYQRPAVITAIRNASHRYVGTFSNGVMSLKQLSDTDGTMYADGTSAATDIATQGKDVFMRLPYFFTRATEIEAYKWKIEFYFDENQTTTSTALPEGENWKQWGGNDLIGVYQASASDAGNNANGGLYSRSGVGIALSISQVNFRTKSRNRGAGYSCVKWRHRNLMAILFYAYYGHTNCRLICGSGSYSYVKTNGLKNSFGMTDTTNANGNTDSTNFWGLENWWGNALEAIDNIVVNSGTCIVTEDDNTTRTIENTVVPPSTGYISVYPSKFVIGENLDTVAFEGQDGGSDSTGYCNEQAIAKADTKNGNNPCAVWCGGTGASVGITNLSAKREVNDYGGGQSSRIAFIGTIEIV